MNKTDLVSTLAGRLNVTKAHASEVVDALFDGDNGIIATQLRYGGEVRLTGFGTFSVARRGERQGTNPATRERITIAARNVPSFKAGSRLKDAVN